jgi:hypothetical protein
MKKFLLVTTSRCRKKVFQTIILDEIDGNQFLCSYPAGKVEAVVLHASDRDFLENVLDTHDIPAVVCLPERDEYFRSVLQDSENLTPFHVVDLKQMSDDPIKTMREICKFLGVRSSATCVKKSIKTVEHKLLKD